MTLVTKFESEDSSVDDRNFFPELVTQIQTMYYLHITQGEK